MASWHPSTQLQFTEPCLGFSLAVVQRMTSAGAAVAAEQWCDEVLAFPPV